MPWLETVPMDQRTKFIADHRQGLYPVTELCARHGISRKTGYKWLARFEEGGPVRPWPIRAERPHHGGPPGPLRPVPTTWTAGRTAREARWRGGGPRRILDRPRLTFPSRIPRPGS
jgi:hypothetical protein